MKKRTVIGVAALLAAAAAVGSCDLFDDPASSTAVAVYGPPPYIETEEGAAETTSTLPDTENDPVPTIFDPSFSTVQPLYGSPEYLESIAEENKVKAAENKEKTE